MVQQMAAAAYPLHRQKRDQSEGGRGGEEQKWGDADGGDIRWMNGD